MKHKLDILIPHYKEPFEVLKPMLDSLELQQSVNFDEFGVIIVNDGNDVVFDKSLFDKYSYSIEYYVAPHKGVSATRNECLDYSNADFVMWCDCDDMMYTNTALWMLIREIDNKEFDTMASAFIEEVVDKSTGEHVYIVRGDAQSGMDSTFVHGKIHRRQYLIDKNIRWNEQLLVHEDSFFISLCQKLSKKVLYCPVTFYLWKWRDDSVCRHDPKYLLKTMPNMLQSNDALVEEFIRRKMRNEAKFYATTMIMECYYQINCKQWMADENKEFKDNLEKCFKGYYSKFEKLYKKIDPQVKTFIIAGIRNRFFQEGLDLESITFDDWIKHIKEDV